MEPKLDAQPDASMGVQPDAVEASSSAERAPTKTVRFKDEADVKAEPPQPAVHRKPAPPAARPPILQFVTGLTYQHIVHGDVLFLRVEHDSHGSSVCLVRKGAKPNRKEFCVLWSDLRIKNGIPPARPVAKQKAHQ